MEYHLNDGCRRLSLLCLISLTGWCTDNLITYTPAGKTRSADLKHRTVRILVIRSDLKHHHSQMRTVMTLVIRIKS